MTTLRKLGLRGVRSYSQAEEESIEFLKPLTIIVGANGSGQAEAANAARQGAARGTAAAQKPATGVLTSFLSLSRCCSCVAAVLRSRQDDHH